VTTAVAFPDGFKPTETITITLPPPAAIELLRAMLEALEREATA
jgi:hypothetical protein